MSPSSLVEIERDGPVATVVLNRPDRRNALNADLMEALEAAAGSFADDADTRVVLLCPTGADFSVGADLRQDRFASAEQPPLVLQRRRLEQGARLLRALRDIHQPTVALLRGVATGGGACIASACDFRIAADDARVGYGEVRIGINLMWNALPLCVQLVGPARAKQMIMTGELFGAATLERWGFVDEVVPVDGLEAAGARWAARFADLPPVAVQMIKRSIDRYAGALDGAVMHADVDQWLLASRTGDFREAVQAFFEKRPPRFEGD